MKRLRNNTPLVERLAFHSAKVKSGCIEWQGTLNNKGYGQIRVSAKTVLAHRVAFEVAHGPLTEGAQVLHKCDNPRCINPDYLFSGSVSDNSNDKIMKNRQARGFQLPHTRLSADDVAAIRASGDLQSVIAQRFGITQPTVSKIRRGARRHLDLMEVS